MVITMKKTILFLMVLFLMVGACGCGRKRETVQERMVAYVNEKYDDTFEFKSVFGGSAGSSTRKIIVSSEKYPGKDVYVVCSYVDEVEVFSDNYLGIKFEEKTKNFLAEAVSKSFGTNYYLQYHPNNLACTEGGNNDTTFDEYIAETSSYISFIAAVKYSATGFDRMAVEEAVRQHFAGMAVVGRIYFIDADVDLTQPDGEELYTSYVEANKHFQKLYFTSSEHQIDTMEWTE